MRLGVLDIGSNTGHLLVVDAHGGAAPLPAYSFKRPLRLAEHLDDAGAVTPTGIAALAGFCVEASEVAEDKGCEEMLAFATSAVRDAVNSDDVLDHIGRATGVELDVLSGEDEARLTFLAVRRWFGWSAGRLAVFDIGLAASGLRPTTSRVFANRSVPRSRAMLGTCCAPDCPIAPRQHRRPSVVWLGSVAQRRALRAPWFLGSWSWTPCRTGSPN